MKKIFGEIPTLSILFALVAISIGASSFDASAVELRDYDYYEYDVRITNPECREYKYDQSVYSVSGERLYAKPKNTYCKSSDAKASERQENSPLRKIKEWLRDESTKEVFLAFLSFSNGEVLDALCDAVEKRDVKVTLILSDGTDMALANKLDRCRDSEGQTPRIELRGHEGGIRYAHNKVILINPNAPNWTDRARIAFSSANLSSGVVLHHENWHFVSTEWRSYFARSHLCLMEGMLEHGRSTSQYSRFIEECRAQIETPEESDIKTFFVPGEGRREATNTLLDGVRRSEDLKIAAHRFTYNRLISALYDKLKYDDRVRLILDDDVYWAGTTGTSVGPNTSGEYRTANGLERSGLEVKYMETNHKQHLLHHNKFLIFDDVRHGKPAVFTGAGNLTGAGFSLNYENFYYIEIPEVVDAFRAQYEHLWNQLATAPGMMPKWNILP